MKRKALFKIAAFGLTLFLSSCDLPGLMTPSRRKSSKEETSEKSKSKSNDVSYYPFDSFGFETSDRSSNRPYSETPSSARSENIPYSQHTHEWGEYVVVIPATCTEDGLAKRTCRICGAEQNRAIKASHTWGDWREVQPATCKKDGVKERLCMVCQSSETDSIPALGHTWEEWEIIDAPTCSQTGRRQHHCKVCDTYEYEDLDPLGHDFSIDNPNNVVEWVQEATCTTSGVANVKCKFCNESRQITVPASGHNFEVVGEDIIPEAGKAQVRLYRCSYCNVTYMGFNVSQVTEESKDTLVFENSYGETGARFFGRPIGNALKLDDTGCSVNQINNEVVYDKNERGSFFEYVFDLTEEQASILSSCQLYCDAKPADYLGNNNGDFWAYGRYDDDWTQGYYIDDNPDHLEWEKNADGTYALDYLGERIPVMTDEIDHVTKQKTGNEIQMGARVANYRYVLYVDGSPVDFDPNISVPAKGTGTNMIRDEYLMPYTFHFHAGTNRISLHMAGGYRSTFFNFMFKPTQGYRVNFVTNNCSVNVYTGPKNADGSNIDTSSTYYTRSKDSPYNYTLQDGRINFEVIPDAGYSFISGLDNIGDELKSDYVNYISGDFNKIVKVDENVFRVTKINSDITITIDCVSSANIYSEAINTWNSDAMRNSFSTAGLSEIYFDSSIVAFKFNRAEISSTLTFISDKAQSVRLQLMLAVKYPNKSLTGFWYQPRDGSTAKTEISVNGAIVTGEEPNFENVQQSGVNDSGALSVPEWFDICNIDLVTGENVIQTRYLTGGYAYYICAARIVA